MNSLPTLVRRHLRLLGVLVFLGTLLVVFELSGLEEHFSLAYLQGEIREQPPVRPGQEHLFPVAHGRDLAEELHVQHPPDGSPRWGRRTPPLTLR